MERETVWNIQGKGVGSRERETGGIRESGSMEESKERGRWKEETGERKEKKEKRRKEGVWKVAFWNVA